MAGRPPYNITEQDYVPAQHYILNAMAHNLLNDTEHRLSL